MTTIVGNSSNTFATPAAAAAAPAAAPAAKPSDTKNLNQTFDQFLLLLTTQLKNQDPMSPMDSSQFTSQLVSFSQVEQQIKTNDNLTKLLAQSNTSQTTLGLSYIGLNVAVQGNQFDFNPATDASVKLNYNLPAKASINTINILDQDGNTVYSANGELGSGTHAFTWNGTDQNGQPVAAGAYTVQVNALDTAQASMNVATQVPGFVTGVETAGDGSINLMIGRQSTHLVPLSSVTQASL